MDWTSTPAPNTHHRDVPAPDPAALCDCLVRMSDFCKEMEHLAGPGGITPGLLWTRTLKEVRSGLTGTRKKHDDSTLECPLNPTVSDAEELKSLPEVMPKAMPKANVASSDHEDVPLASKNYCKVSLKRKRGDP